MTYFFVSPSHFPSHPPLCASFAKQSFLNFYLDHQSWHLCHRNRAVSSIINIEEKRRAGNRENKGERRLTECPAPPKIIYR